MRSFFALSILILIVTSQPAGANFVDLDVDFDDATVGASLQRRGAEFEEPIAGPFESTTDEIVDINGDLRVQITDTGSTDPELLYWGFLGNQVIDTGQMVLECIINVSDLTEAVVGVSGPSGQDIFFNLVLFPSGNMAYLDAGNLNPTVFGTYIPRDDMSLRLEFDLDAGRYNFSLNGASVFTSRSHGVTSGIEHMLIGFGQNATGEVLLQDEIFAYHTVAVSGQTLLEADFNNKPQGPISTGGAIVNEPVSLPVNGAEVTTGGFPSKSLLVCDETVTEETVRFEFLNAEEVSSGRVCVRYSARFDQPEAHIFRVRERPSNGDKFSSLFFSYAGTINIADENGTLPGFVPYVEETRVDVRICYLMDAGTYYLWIDDTLAVKGRSHGAAGGVGSLNFGYVADVGSAGCFQIDDILVVKDLDTATSAPGAVSLADRPQLLPATPNPFNPATQLSFELPRASNASLRLYDATGRWVTTLLERPLAAGSHSLSWDGRDFAGRRVGSGVYFAHLRAGSYEDRQKLVLVK